MQLPIMTGITAKDGTFAESYPVNIEPRASDSGVSKGQLVSTRGAVTKGTGPGADRGSILWNGVHYRVMGSKLVSVASDGAVVVLGEVGNDYRPVRLDYGFDKLSVPSAGGLYYWNGSLVQVTDTDLGVVKDAMWIDGYYMTTDGTFVIVTDLLDPASVNPLRYGSAESDPDPVVCLLKYQGEALALGRYTITPFSNIGGTVFPFSPVLQGIIPYGCIGAAAKCLFGDHFAFIGGGRNETLGLFIGSQGSATRISSYTIDALLAAEPFPELIELEAREFPGERQILIHLADRTVGLSLATSAAAEKAAWFILDHDGPHRARHGVVIGGEQWVGDAFGTAVGTLSDSDARQFGEAIDWQFETAVLYNESLPFQIHEAELTGQFPVGGTSLFLSMTRDGVVWSPEVSRVHGGRRDERATWRPGARIPKLAGFRWRGSGRVAISAAQINAEPLG